ncbi:hypothetical protein [Roseovarius salinarum]|uniref:hypothetical protein n=1 Tax=Roseovarius salinarum TaxID=1981892 RepID=UPI000C33F6C4|nr:hypothetical protein [Roseovarius salinarum]
MITRSPTIRAAALAVVLALPAVPVPAASPIAEVICEPTPRMERKLRREFGETRVARGLRGVEQVMEVWTDARGDWTLVVRYASGTSCIVAMGEDWQGMPETPA